MTWTVTASGTLVFTKEIIHPNGKKEVAVTTKNAGNAIA
eukprot:CAMPEP_0113529202 /NCGR_PEP_ID=MMETSP0015_2-20120614/2266_1 /TAXON_ID=2838 /ORGANISM="Odontella" /LENGTH=38 /DNA_ID=CAMNT_0000427813 /DNA_START=141 /DNA_END=257 /DNA_ORIENTATION=- /assembly_acc=CAM_ASM_000160